MKKIYTLAIALFGTFAFAQTTIADWNFDADTPAEAMLPTTGNGTFSLLGGVEDNLTSGNMPVGVEPGTTTNGGKAYSIKTFPEQGTESGTAGFQFAVSTAGYNDIAISFDPRSSNTGSKWQQFEYSIDGGENWVIFGNNEGNLENNFNNPVSLTLPADVNNSADFTFRIVSIFAPGTSAYEPVGNNYGTGGAWRIDNFNVSGTATASVKNNDIAGLSVYPNPVSGNTLYVTSNNSVEKSVAIFDVLGKQVINTTTVNGAVNVANLNAGVYIVKVTEEGKTATRKLVVK